MRSRFRSAIGSYNTVWATGCCAVGCF